MVGPRGHTPRKIRRSTPEPGPKLTGLLQIIIRMITNLLYSPVNDGMRKSISGSTVNFDPAQQMADEDREEYKSSYNSGLDQSTKSLLHDGKDADEPIHARSTSSFC